MVASRTLELLLACTLGLLGPVCAGVGVFEDTAEWCRRFPCRALGQPGNDEAGAYVAERFAAAGVATGVQAFGHPVLSPGRAELEVAGQRFDIHPLQPNLVDAGNLPGGEWRGRLAYAGDGEPRDLSGLNLVGAAALMEFNCEANWLTVVQSGAGLVLFLEPEETSNRQAVAKVLAAPLSIPRFLVPRSAAPGLRELVRSGSGLAAQVRAAPRLWRADTLHNWWAIVPGTSKAGEVVHVQVALDSNSVCPDRPGGAESAANLAIFFRLFDRVRAAPVSRTVVFSVVNAHRDGMVGARQYAWSVLASADALDEDRRQLRDALAIERYVLAAFGQPLDAALVEHIRTCSSRVGGKTVELRKPIQQTLTTRLNEGRQEIARLQKELRRTGLTAEVRARAEATIAETRRAGELVVRLMSMFNKFGRRVAFAELSADEQTQLRAAFADVVETSSRAEVSLLEDLAEAETNAALRRALAGTKTALYLFLDCSFHDRRVGFFNQSHMQSSDDVDLVKAAVKFSRNTLELAAEVATGLGLPSQLEDTILNNAGVAWQNHLADTVATPALFGNEALVPSVALLTVRDLRPYRYTTLDDLEHLPRNNLEVIGAFLDGYLPVLLDRGLLGEGYSVLGRNYTSAIRLLVRRVDAFSITVPQVEVPGAIVLLRPKSALGFLYQAWSPMRGDVRIDYPMITDRRGSATARMLRRGAEYRSEVFAFDPDGRVNQALDQGRMETRFSSNLASAIPVTERILAVFPCAKYDFVGLLEPRTFEPVRSLDVIDALQESTPLSFGLSGVPPHPGCTTKELHLVRGNVACVFLDPAIPFKLRFGAGLLLNNTLAEPTGTGYSGGQVPSAALRLAMARDAWTLDQSRLQRLQARGVHNAMATRLHEQASDLIREAEALRARGRVQSFLNRATEALGVEYRAYPAILGTTNDMIKAVVIFLGLVIPFCFFIMKLTCFYTQIGRQLLWFVGAFGLTFVVLRLVHPVFGLTSAPWLVLIAFVMLGLALFVSWVLYARFDDEMGKVLNQFSDAEGAVEAPRSRLAGVAFSVGVNNMKRRRIRTTLTCATVVLVTFTMLSFTSVTEHTNPARARLGGDTPYNGFLFLNPGLAPLDDSVVRSVRALFEEQGEVVSRVWAQRLNQYGGYMPYALTSSDGAQVLEAKVILGLEAAEDGFAGRMPLVAGRWLARDDAAEVILSVRAGSYVGITPESLAGQALILNGMRLPVVGLVEDEALEGRRDIAGLPLLPLEQTPSLAAAQKQAQDMQAGKAMSATGDPAAGSMPLRPQDVVIASAGLARLAGGASTRALAVRHSSAHTTWEVAHRVIRYANNRLLVSLRDDVPVGQGSAVVRAGAYGLLPSVGKSVGGLATIVIPLIIGATIILNTMLGAVMERKREIGVYNAIGLNPTHVAVFFVAESLVFGLVGSVLGYLIGQSISKAVVAVGAMEQVNMNYSSLTVVMVIFLTIATVLLSTVYPALMATRAAVPSGKRKWALPVPQGDEMVVDFPFSYDEKRVLGVLGYLHSFFELNSEASSGRFVAEPVAIGRVPERAGATGHTVWAMVHAVSLAPFDLGVNQRTELYAYFDPKVGAYMLTMHLVRRAGEESNWKTANKPFLEGLRQHLLRWRSQTAAAQERYYRAGAALFHDASLLA